MRCDRVRCGPAALVPRSRALLQRGGGQVDREVAPREPEVHGHPGPADILRERTHALGVVVQGLLHGGWRWLAGGLRVWTAGDRFLGEGGDYNDNGIWVTDFKNWDDWKNWNE